LVTKIGRDSLEELESEFEPLTQLVKALLADRVKKMIASNRIADSICVLTTSEITVGPP